MQCVTTKLKQCSQGHENPLSARFCDECGEQFPATIEEIPEEDRSVPIPVPSRELLFDRETLGVTNSGEVLVLLGPRLRLVFFPALSADRPGPIPQLGAVTGLGAVVWEHLYVDPGWQGKYWLRPADYREAPVVAKETSAGSYNLRVFAQEWEEAQRIVAGQAAVGSLPDPFASFCKQVVSAEGWFLERLRLENIAVAVR